MYYEMWNEAINTLIKHLKLPNATWKDERCASMRFISRCYQNLNRLEEARMWLDKAIEEAPYLRDPFIERALLEYRDNNFKEVKKYCLKALEINKHTKTYINEIFSCDYTVYDLLSLAYFYENNMEKALKYVNIAIDMNTDKNNQERLLKNKNIIQEKNFQ